MLQQFFKNTNETKFIKNILENFSLPLYKTVSNLDYIVSGQKYIYNNQIIKCINSGYIDAIYSDNYINGTYSKNDISFFDTYLLDLSAYKEYDANTLPKVGNQFYKFKGPANQHWIRYFSNNHKWEECPNKIANITVKTKTESYFIRGLTTPISSGSSGGYLIQFDSANNTKKINIINDKSFSDNLSLSKQEINKIQNDFNKFMRSNISTFPTYTIEEYTCLAVIDDKNNLIGVYISTLGYSDTIPCYVGLLYKLKFENSNYTSKIYIDLEGYINARITIGNQDDEIRTIRELEKEIEPEKFNTNITAKYTLLDNYAFNKNYIDVSQYKTSRYDYYDSETHKYLGDYLRYISKTKQVNLMPYYNCFNYKIANSFGFDRKTLKVVDKNNGYKIYLTPIKFNTDYTVALEHPLNALYKFVFYGKFGLIKPVDEDKNIHYLDDSIPNNEVKSKSFTFNKPCILRCNCDDSKLNDYEKYLYLAIQVPTTNTSSFVVLEGDFTKPCAKKVYINITSETEDSKYSAQLDNVLFTKSQLLELNDGNIYAYSSRLIEYLTENVVDTNDIHEQDVIGVQNKIYTTPTGMYDLALRYKIFTDINHNSGLNQTDLNGYIDRDTEKYISERYK